MYSQVAAYANGGMKYNFIYEILWVWQFCPVEFFMLIKMVMVMCHIDRLIAKNDAIKSKKDQ